MRDSHAGSSLRRTCLKTFRGEHGTILKRRAVPVAVQLDGLPGWHRTGWRYTRRQPVLGRRNGALADANTEGYLDSAHCRGCGAGGKRGAVQCVLFSLAGLSMLGHDKLEMTDGAPADAGAKEYLNGTHCRGCVA